MLGITDILLPLPLFMSHNFVMPVDSVHLLEALQGLVRVGASDHLLGEAVRELLSPGTQSSRRPHAPPAEPQEQTSTVPVSFPDPTARGSQDVGPPPAPVPSTSAHVVTRTPSPAPLPLKARKSEPTKPEIIVFKDQSGKRSSVSISPADWEKLLVYASGDVSRTRALVRSAAAQAPQDVNRSQWVVSTILSSNLS